MKKVFALTLAVLLVLSVLTACSSKPTNVTDNQQSSNTTEDNHTTDTSAPSSELQAWGDAMKEKYGGTTINVLLASHTATDGMLAMVDEFTQLTGIEVNSRILASTEMKTMQRSNSSTKTGIFDVYMVDAFTVYEYAKAGYIENLEPYLEDPEMTPEWYDYEDILLAYRDGIASVEGEAYLLPVAGETRIVFYRTDLFEEHEKEIPQTLDEWLELCQYFQEAGNGDK